jgi:hypothetical protein
MVVAIGEAGNHAQYINDYRFDPFNTFSHERDRAPNAAFVEFSVDKCVGVRFASIPGGGGLDASRPLPPPPGRWPLPFVVALADIEEGEEALVDYGVGYWANMRDLVDKHGRLVAAQESEQNQIRMREALLADIREHGPG